MRRYEIESFYYSDVTKELIELDQDGKFRKQIREYENYTAEESDLMALDRLEIEKYTPHISDRKQLLSRRNFLKEVFELSGLSDDEYPLITNKPIHKDQLNDCIDYLKKNNVKIQRWFNKTLRSDIDKNPVAQLGAFLKLFGIKWKRTTKKRSDDGKDYYYEIPQEIIDLLDSMVNTRKDSQFKEKWHLDRSNITENRLFPPESDIRHLIRQQIKTQKINPVKKTDSW